MRQLQSKSPHALRRSAVYLDNIALVPASLLPLRAKWKEIADSLPHGETLIILPSQRKQQCVAHSVASQLRAKGKLVAVIDRDLRRSTL